jgi:hypothetical protein
MAIQPRGTGEIKVDVISAKTATDIDITSNLSMASVKRFRERTASISPNGLIQSTATVIAQAISICVPTDMAQRAISLPNTTDYLGGCIWTVINGGSVSLRVYPPAGDEFAPPPGGALAEAYHILQPEDTGKYVYDGTYWRTV